MSVEAISWALHLAPVPVGRGGQPPSACKYSSAWPTMRGRAARARSRRWPRWCATGLSERTMRACVDRLEAGGDLSGLAEMVTVRSQCRR